MAYVITSNSYYEIFSLPVDWNVDRLVLDRRYHQLQQEFHPDRFAARSDVDKRLAVQTASFINDAYDTLITPIKRARYLLQLDGVESDQERHITTDTSFLMQQIELREELDDFQQKDNFSQAARSALEALKERTHATYNDLQTQFNTFYAARQQSSASEAIAKMQFFAKFLEQIELLEEQLDG